MKQEKEKRAQRDGEEPTKKRMDFMDGMDNIYAMDTKRLIEH